MSKLTAAEVKSFLLRHLNERLAARGLSTVELSDDLDLLKAGLIDSVGLIEMITALEVEFQLEIDFEQLPVDDLPVVGPLCKYIEKRAADGEVPT